MEKVKVTKEQAKGLNQITTPQSAVKEHVGNWQMGNRLNDLTLDELIRALYIGYEVEPEFKVGDWIIDKSVNKIGKITENINGRDIYNDGREISYSLLVDVRHATPSEIAEEKERRFWARYDRDVWELRKGDVLHDEMHGDTIVVSVVNSQNDMTAVFYADDYMYLSDIKKYFKVAVFSKDRLDVKTNE
ncbi:hypothetical protein [Oceanobacillus sp. FSL H7-0719]|uniref:hypothetical protein n=1 Tax=Oceanobacillus sp. FSL H7-0719 TaxID=2954507 RepID=UPI00324AE1C6